MNAILIAGVIGLIFVWQRRRRPAPRRARHVFDDEVFSHALQPSEKWADDKR